MPARNRKIFSLCRKIMKSAAANPNSTNSVGSSKMKAKIGVAAAAIIDATETYLVAMKIASQIKKTIAVTFGIIIAITPKPVATPLPPRSFKNMLNV